MWLFKATIIHYFCKFPFPQKSNTNQTFLVRVNQCNKRALCATFCVALSKHSGDMLVEILG